jgi:hypothetical protein
MKKKITDRDVWNAMDLLSRAISEKARKFAENDPRGAAGECLENAKAEKAKIAAMALGNAICQIFKKYTN